LAGDSDYRFGGRIAARVECPRCGEKRNVCFGQLEDVWYFLCGGCAREFRMTFDVEDICDHACRI
jgi:hypothetical protein